MINSLEQDKKDFFGMLKSHAFFKEKIILSSGKESEYYIDARRVTLTSKGAYLCARIMLDMVKDESYDAIGGPTLGADPIIGAIGVLMYQGNKAVNTFIIRKASKTHGKQQQIEGPLVPEGAEVILIDDVATTGKAFLESIDVLAKNGIKVKKAICIVDRQEGAKEAVAAKNCELVSIFTAEEFIGD